MAEAKSNRFTKYFPLLLDALRSADPNAMRPAEALAWIRAKVEVPAEDLTRFVQNGTQSIFENDVHWARFYLVKAGLLGNTKRGLWSLTPEGREARLSPEETWDLYVRIRDANRPGNAPVDEDAPAPGTTGESEEEGRSYWFVGAVWNGTEDQLPRFLEQGVWENGYEDQFLALVRERDSDAERGDEGFIEPIVAGGEATKILEPAEGPFDDIAPPIGDWVERIRLLAVFSVGDDNPTAAIGQPIA